MRNPSTPVGIRILRRVAAAQEGCWPWQGAIHRHGYGHIKYGATMRNVARVAYEVFVGPIPDGLVIDHLCRNRACCNPLHLEAVTTKENVLRGIGPTAINARLKVCKRGHDLTGDNVRIVNSNGSRWCRACDVIRQRAARLRKKQKAAP